MKLILTLNTGETVKLNETVLEKNLTELFNASKDVGDDLYKIKEMLSTGIPDNLSAIEMKHYLFILDRVATLFSLGIPK